MSKWLLFFGLISYSILGWARETILEMSCKIQSQNVTTIIDGKPTVYSGYKGGSKVGDSLFLKGFIDGSDISFFFYDKSIDQTYITMVSSFDEFKQVKFNEEKGLWGGDQFRMHRISWYPNSIHLKGTLGQMNLYRYYKSDWDGIFFDERSRTLSKNEHSIHIMSLDCRTIINRLEEIYPRFPSRN